MITDLLARDKLQILQHGFGLGALVGLDIADDHVHALTLALVGAFQHGVGLAHAGHVAQENFKTPALLLIFFSLDAGEQFIGIGAVLFGLGRHGLILSHK